MLDLPLYTSNDWINCLKKYHREDLTIILDNNKNDYEKTLEIFFLSDGACNTIKFGGDNIKNKALLDRFKAECWKFFCGDKDNKYKFCHQQLKKLVKAGPKDYLTYIAASLSHEIGVTKAALIIPLVVVLTSITMIGINSYCSLRV
jgi:hypothetical protein